MKKEVLILLLLIGLMISCEQQPRAFEFTIKGQVAGQESGKFYLMTSPRLGDEVVIEFDDHFFEYTGTSPWVHSTIIALDRNLTDVFEIVIEPGEIILELDMENFYMGSRVIAGDLNLQRASDHELLMSYNMNPDLTQEEILEFHKTWMIENNQSMTSLGYLASWEKYNSFMKTADLKEYLEGVKDPLLRSSKSYIELYSMYLARKNEINAQGQQSENFILPDSQGKNIRFSDIARGKLVYVEMSGSWCGNTTRNTRNLLPVYEKFKDQGLEIVTIVPESNHDRWLHWLEKESFPWINLVELDSEVAVRGYSYAEKLFDKGNYLVDKDGNVLANNLSAELLHEVLLKTFDPEAYTAFQQEKWQMPEGITILDKEEPVGSFDYLLELLGGRAFLIDCWATWCSPCFEEFKHNEPLKAFLESRNMAMVYINFDQPDAEATWLNTIRKQNLTGYHFRLNDSFRKDLSAIGFMGGLPAYMIVDQQGRVVEKNAYRPSQAQLLYDQIDQLLLNQ